jgi:hypothetical protein
MIENRTLNEALGLLDGGGKEHFLQLRGDRSQGQFVLHLHRGPSSTVFHPTMFYPITFRDTTRNPMPGQYVQFKAAQDFAVVFRVA